MRFGFSRSCRLGLLAVALVCGLAATVRATVEGSDAALSVITDGNALEARQFKIDNARLPGQLSMRQSVIAWQVTQGSWNGQVLDGLCVVLVKTTSEDGRSTGSTNCYISHEATMAQRQALLGALMATQPQLMASHNLTRIEPAVITLEIEGTTVVLHLGLVA